jgi:hypothetical protein
MQKMLKAVQGWLPMTLIVLGSLWLLQATLARTSGHGVIVQGLNYNAGTVKQGATVSHEIRIINLTSQPVEVDAQPSCGCTVLYTPQADIAPLHSDRVMAQIDTDGVGTGSQHKGVFLRFHSGKVTWQQVASIRFSLSN